MASTAKCPYPSGKIFDYYYDQDMVLIKFLRYLGFDSNSDQILDLVLFIF